MSTEYLDRDTAEKMYVEFKQEDALRKVRAEAVGMTNKELEDVLEEIQHERCKRHGDHTGYGYEYYHIR